MNLFLQTEIIVFILTKWPVLKFSKLNATREFRQHCNVKYVKWIFILLFKITFSSVIKLLVF